MKKMYIIVGLLLLGINASTQNQLTNFGNLRMFNGAALTTFGDFTNSGTLTVDSGATLNNKGTLTNVGSISNAGSFVYAGTSTLIYSGSGQQTIGTELPGTNGPADVQINNSNGIVLGVDATVNNLTFTSGNLQIDGRTLTINGTITNTSGAITGGSNANINFAGNSGTIKFDQTNSLSRTLNNFTINKTSSTLTLGNAVEVTGSLNLNNGTLATAGNLKLVSNINGTARVAAIAGTGAITGNVIVERYIPSAARRWRFMSSNVSSTTLEDWRGEIFVTGAGTGTTVGTQNSNGFDATASNSPSVYYYDETIGGNMNYGWTASTSTSTTLTVGKGYRVFVRGDRSSVLRLTGVDNSQNAVTMNLIGPINTGDVTMPVTYTNTGLTNDDGWNLLGNPYPCQYDWNAFWNTGNSGNNGTFYSNIGPTIYVWDAASNTYKSFNALSNSGSITNGIISSGQAFFVKATSVSPSLTFKEQFKSVSTPLQMFKSSGAGNEMQISLILDSVNIDDFNLKYNAASTSLDDIYDIKKWANPTVNISSYGRDSVIHSLDSRPILAGNDTINLSITGSNGTYKFLLKVLPLGKQYFLQDLYLGNTLPIFEGTSYTFTIQSSIAATQGYSRFRIISSDNSFLPVSFGLFDVQKVDRKVRVNWNTFSEINSSRFEIERSSDSINFISIGIIKAKGNSNTVLNYAFIDERPSFSTDNYYRIKEVDINEKYSFSEVRNVSFLSNIINLNTDRLSVYPNPATSKTTLICNQILYGDCEIYIYSTQGNCVKYFKPSNQKSDEFEVNVNDLLNGIYFVRVVDANGNSLTEKLLIE